MSPSLTISADRGIAAVLQIVILRFSMAWSSSIRPPGLKLAEPKSIYRDQPHLGLGRPIGSSGDLFQDVTYFARRLRDFLFAKSGKAE
jgi:hypothetical protein